LTSATLDTNVFIRAFNFGGPAAILPARARAGEIRIDISEPILKETIGVLREKFERDPYTLNDIRQKLIRLCNTVSPTEALNVIREDPDDDRILECAAAAKSDYIVSEDKDLLRLVQYGGARIVNIAEFLQVIVEQARGAKLGCGLSVCTTLPAQAPRGGSYSRAIREE
jgi:putative PIN family toxin of toxin-antitoxin system